MHDVAGPSLDGTAYGMATTKVTVTLGNEQVAAVRRLVTEGKARNVSSFVQHAVAVSLADVAGWGAMLGLALEACRTNRTPSHWRRQARNHPG